MKMGYFCPCVLLYSSTKSTSEIEGIRNVNVVFPLRFVIEKSPKEIISIPISTSTSCPKSARETRTLGIIIPLGKPMLTKYVSAIIEPPAVPKEVRPTDIRCKSSTTRCVIQDLVAPVSQIADHNFGVYGFAWSRVSDKMRASLGKRNKRPVDLSVNARYSSIFQSFNHKAHNGCCKSRIIASTFLNKIRANTKRFVIHFIYQILYCFSIIDNRLILNSKKLMTVFREKVLIYAFEKIKIFCFFIFCINIHFFPPLRISTIFYHNLNKKQQYVSEVT